jgi:hypothetical protein
VLLCLCDFSVTLGAAVRAGTAGRAGEGVPAEVQRREVAAELMAATISRSSPRDPKGPNCGHKGMRWGRGQAS